MAASLCPCAAGCLHCQCACTSYAVDFFEELHRNKVEIMLTDCHLLIAQHVHSIGVDTKVVIHSTTCYRHMLHRYERRQDVWERKYDCKQQNAAK